MAPSKRRLAHQVGQVPRRAGCGPPARPQTAFVHASGSPHALSGGRKIVCCSSVYVKTMSPSGVKWPSTIAARDLGRPRDRNWSFPNALVGSRLKIKHLMTKRDSSCAILPRPGCRISQRCSPRRAKSANTSHGPMECRRTQGVAHLVMCLLLSWDSENASPALNLAALAVSTLRFPCTLHSPTLRLARIQLHLPKFAAFTHSLCSLYTAFALCRIPALRSLYIS